MILQNLLIKLSQFLKTKNYLVKVATNSNKIVLKYFSESAQSDDAIKILKKL